MSNKPDAEASARLASAAGLRGRRCLQRSDLVTDGLAAVLDAHLVEEAIQLALAAVAIEWHGHDKLGVELGDELGRLHAPPAATHRSHAHDLDRPDVARRLRQQVADVTEMNDVKPVELIDEACVVAAFLAELLVAEGAHPGHEDLVDVVLAGRIEQESRFEAGRNRQTVAPFSSGRASLRRGGRGRQTKGWLPVRMAVGDDVGSEAASSRAHDSGVGVRNHDALAATKAKAGLAERGDFHGLIVGKANEGRLPNWRPSFRGREREPEAMLRGSAGQKIGRLREATRRQTVKKQTSSKGCHNPRMTRNQRRPNAGRLATCALVSALLAGCVSISPNPTTSLQPTASPRPTTGQTSSPTPNASLQPTSTQTSTPTPVNTHEGATPPPATPAATIDPALAAQIDAVVAQVPPIRELDALATVPYEFISRDQFRSDLIALNDQEVTPEQQATEERFLKRMGLLPSDADLNALLLELYGGSVAAFYRPTPALLHHRERPALRRA